jgi:hypothetical protein
LRVRGSGASDAKRAAHWAARTENATCSNEKSGKKPGNAHVAFLFSMTKPMKKRFLKGNSSLIVIGSKPRGSNPRKENFGCNEESSAQPKRGLFFFWQRESGVGVSQGVVIERL